MRTLLSYVRLGLASLLILVAASLLDGAGHICREAHRAYIEGIVKGWVMVQQMEQK